MGAAAVAGVAGLLVDYLRTDWIYVVSIDRRPRDALAD